MEPEGIQDETYWLDRLKQGERQALSYFYDLHYQSLCYFAIRLTQDEEQAKEIVADGIFKLWKKHRDFENGEKIKAFLYVTCRNDCLQYLRNLKRKTAAQQLYFDQLVQNEKTILQEIIEAEFLKMLDLEINQLPKKCAEVFKLIYFMGKKTDEIALELDISVKTVRSHKANALELLKTAFLKKGITGPFFLAFLLFTDRI